MVILVVLDLLLCMADFINAASCQQAVLYCSRQHQSDQHATVLDRSKVVTSCAPIVRPNVKCCTVDIGSGMLRQKILQKSTDCCSE
jgi:hypothetical protein